MATETITLGKYTFPVVPQKHARLRNRLSADDFQKVMSAEYASESYRILCVLIPAMDPMSRHNQAHEAPGMPLWEWEGYNSLEAMQAGEYDEDNDPSPTTSEIVNAFETSLMVSGAGRLGKIVDLVSAAGSLTKSTQTPTPLSPASLGNGGE